MQPTRIALDATPLLGVKTGIGEFCAGALESLARRPEVDVSAFAVSWRRRNRLLSRLPEEVAAQQRPMPARPLNAAWSKVPWPPLEWFVGRVDLVHGTNFVVPPTRSAAKVVTVHDLTALRFPQLCHPSSLRFPGMVKEAVAQGAWVHTPSGFVAHEVIERLGVPAERVRAVHHGIPRALGQRQCAPDQFASPATLGSDLMVSEDRRPLPFALPDGCNRFVVAVGTVEPRKDLPGLVRAFDRLAGKDPALALVIAGPNGWGTQALIRARSESKYGGRVVRTGYMSDEDLDVVLARAELLVFPSVYEGFGFPPLQAMAIGLPVVATDAGAIPEVVGDGAVVVPVGDVEALAEAIGSVLDDDGLRKDLIRRGWERSQLFTWDSCAAGLVSLYADVMAART